MFDGQATVTDGDQQTDVKKDKQVMVDAPKLKAQKFDKDAAEASDPLYSWSKLRSEYLAEATASTAQTYIVDTGGCLIDKPQSVGVAHLCSFDPARRRRGCMVGVQGQKRLDVAAAARGVGAEECSGVIFDLFFEDGVEPAAFDDGMGRACIGAWSHGGDVGRFKKEETCGACAAAGW